MKTVIPQHSETFGPFRRKDDEEFAVTGVIWESPPYQDYWLAGYTAAHAEWGTLRFTLIVPKHIAPTIELGRALLGGAPLDQVKSELVGATAGGKSFHLCPSPDGWTLLG